MNILTGLAAVSQIIKECITSENTPEGMLNDVLSVITVVNNEEGIDEPAIWINEHPTIPYDNAKTKLSQDIDLATTFEFVCIEYDPDPETAELKGKNLASRACLAVMKNFQHIQKKYGMRVIKNIHFVAFYPVGEISIKGKREKVPATSIVLSVVHNIDWLKCCKRKNNENNNDDNDDGD